MLKLTISIGLTCVLMTGCGAGGGAAVANQNSGAPANGTASAPAATKANDNAPAKMADEPVAKPSVADGPKRISFTKGSTNAIEYFDLEPGESRRFVVGAVKGQDLTVGSGGDLKITMLTKGKTVDEKSDETGYNGTTIAGGDFTFEVTNTLKKKNKTSINVIIQTIGDD